MLQERIEEEGKPPWQWRIDRQYVWGLRGLDDLILRDRDADGDGKLDERLYALSDVDGSIVSLYDVGFPRLPNGQPEDMHQGIVERIEYDPFGRPRFLAPDFQSRKKSSHDWNILFNGNYFDAEIGCYQVDGRFYLPGYDCWLNDELIVLDDQSHFRFDTLDGPLAKEKREWKPSEEYDYEAARARVNEWADYLLEKNQEYLGAPWQLANPVTLPIYLGNSQAIDAERRALLAYLHTRQAGYSVGASLYLAAATPLADLTGITGLSNAWFGQEAVTGERLSAGERWMQGGMGAVQLVGTAFGIRGMGYGLGRALAPRGLPTLPSGYHYRNIGGQNVIARNPGQSKNLPKLYLQNNQIVSKVKRGNPRRHPPGHHALIPHGGQGRMTFRGFLGNQFGRLVPPIIRDSKTLNLIGPDARYFGIIRRFANKEAYMRWHYRVDPYYFPLEAIRGGLPKYGIVGRLWHGSPQWVQESMIGLSAANVGAWGYAGWLNSNYGD